jgi:hypothetical protein
MELSLAEWKRLAPVLFVWLALVVIMALNMCQRRHSVSGDRVTVLDLNV